MIVSREAHVSPGITVEQATQIREELFDLIDKLAATKAVLADRERELMEIKGPCSGGTVAVGPCRLHYDHSGPCDIRLTRPAHSRQTEEAADIDCKITGHLADLIRRDESPPTVYEISDRLAVSVTRVRASIRRLVGSGKVRVVGVALSGGSTWTLMNPTRKEIT